MLRFARKPSKKPSIFGCAGLDWGRVNFFHSSFYGAVFCICAGKSVENPGKFLLLLNCAYTESRPFLLATSKYAGGPQSLSSGLKGKVEEQGTGNI